MIWGYLYIKYIFINLGKYKRVMKQVTAEISDFSTVKAEILFKMAMQLFKKKLIHFQIICAKGLAASPNYIF